MRDQESQPRGNEPYCVPVLTEEGQNPAGFGVETRAEDFNLIINAERAAPDYRNSTTIQTYYRIASWEPFGAISMLSTPLMLLIPENDRISSPEKQKAIFDSTSGPKRCHVEPGKGHVDIPAGDSFPKLMEK